MTALLSSSFLCILVPENCQAEPHERQRTTTACAIHHRLSVTRNKWVSVCNVKTDKDVGSWKFRYVWHFRRGWLFGRSRNPDTSSLHPDRNSFTEADKAWASSRWGKESSRFPLHHSNSQISQLQIFFW